MVPAKSKGLLSIDPMLREIAKDLGKIMKVDFDPSPNWVTRWRERNLIVFKRKHGEKQDHYSEAAEHCSVSMAKNTRASFCLRNLQL